MSSKFTPYIELATGLDVQTCPVTENNQAFLSGTYSPIEMKAGEILVIFARGRWVSVAADDFEQYFILKEKMEFKSAAAARGYLEELSHAISNAAEEGLDAAGVRRAKMELRLVKKFLGECEEPA